MSETSRTVACRQVIDLLDLLAAGDLPAEETGILLVHVESCTACRAVFARRREFTTALRNELSAGAAQAEPVDLWPRVREEAENRTRRWAPVRWLLVEPVRALSAAAVLTAGLYVLLTHFPGGKPAETAGIPIYESAAVVVTAARIDHQPARVSGFESGDGNTVFLWLEGAR